MCDIKMTAQVPNIQFHRPRITSNTNSPSAHISANLLGSTEEDTLPRGSLLTDRLKIHVSESSSTREGLRTGRHTLQDVTIQLRRNPRNHFTRIKRRVGRRWKDGNCMRNFELGFGSGNLQKIFIKTNKKVHE